MSFELRFPAGSGSPTNVWQPGKDFDIRKSGQEPLTSTIAQIVGKTVYAYRFETIVWMWLRGFSDLPYSEILTLEAFFAAVDGATFDFKDGSCGPITSFQEVTLVPESYVRPYGHVNTGGLMEVAFKMIDAS